MRVSDERIAAWLRVRDRDYGVSVSDVYGEPPQDCPDWRLWWNTLEVADEALANKATFADDLLADRAEQAAELAKHKAERARFEEETIRRNGW